MLNPLMESQHVGNGCFVPSCYCNLRSDFPTQTFEVIIDLRRITVTAQLPQEKKQDCGPMNAVVDDLSNR